MSDVVQFVACSSCGAQAKKTIGNFAVVGRAEAGIGDGPAPWDAGGLGGDDDGMGGLDGFGGDDHGHDHGHSHGPGGHTH